jgi:hypothetical protein
MPFITFLSFHFGAGHLLRREQQRLPVTFGLPAVWLFVTAIHGPALELFF